MAEHAYETVLLDIDGLVPNDRNVNSGDVGAIATAIAVDGFHGQVVAQKQRGKPKIIAGEHRWRALAALQADGIVLDGEHKSYEQLLATKGLLLPPAGKVPVQVLSVDDVRAVRKMIADNRASSLAVIDDSGLASLLQELASDDALLGSLFDGDDIDDLLHQIEEDAPPLDEPAVPREQSHTCPECGFQWTGKSASLV